MDLYDRLRPNKLERNPAEKEIKSILNKYEKVTVKLDKEAARLKNIKQSDRAVTELKRLGSRADQSIKKLNTSAERWARIAGPKSHLTGQALAESFIKKQSSLKMDNGKMITILKLKPKDKLAVKEMVNRVTLEVLREVRMINGGWRKRFDEVVRKGIKEARGLTLVKQAGSRGGVTTVEEIGTKLYNLIKYEGLKLEDSLGRRWRPERYIRMYSRTRTREIQTRGIEHRMNDYDLDLVQISEHLDVDGQDICNDYEGNVYSLSGNHPRYPILDITPPFHPNCVHVMTPWVEEYQLRKSA